jgi:ketosteroid isomerase-like protein
MKSIFFIPLLFVSTVFAQEPDSSSALFRLREAERNFAKASLMYGRNAAFVGSFADVSVIFTNTWINNGKQYYQERKVNPVVLKWEPEFMDISASGDFGISTGPWEAQEYRPNTSPVSTGYFLSAWKKDAQGVWKVILDAGSATPPAAGEVHTFSFPKGADRPVSDLKSMNVKDVCNELSENDKQFFTEWEKNHKVSSYISFLNKGARLQRNGHLPSTNADTIRVWLSGLDKSLTWRVAGSGAASSGDLGFTYGLLGVKSDASVVKGHYVRMWKRNSAGQWKIIIDMINFD